MAAKTKTIELTARVQVPANWTAAHTKREVAGAMGGWSGIIYALGPSKGPYELRDDVVLRPRWTGAHVVKKEG